MKTSTLQAVIEAYKTGVNDERDRLRDLIEDKDRMNSNQAVLIEELKREINELTTNQWSIIKQVFEKCYPSNATSLLEEAKTISLRKDFQ